MEERNPMHTLPHSFTPSGGDGIHSYARNSSLQRAGIVSAKGKMREAIFKMLDLHNPYFDLNIFKVGDFGCSIGSNTFDVVQNIIDAVKLKYREESNLKILEDVEFHVFLNDQPNNDFSTLFRTLPPYPDRGYSVAGVPGSFHGRLFPRNSLHIGHTSYTLDWLSRAPQDVCGLNSRPYKEQFEKDLVAFLRGRAEELVPGGLMIILGMCLPDDVPWSQTFCGVLFDLFADCLIDIAKSGETSEEKLKSFKLPLYLPRVSEMKEAMERNGWFSIEMMEELKNPMEGVSLSNHLLASSFRAMCGGALEEHFGVGFVDGFFHRFAAKLAGCPIDFQSCEKDKQQLILLKRTAL